MGPTQKRYNLVLWQKVCKKKEYGGLSVLNLQEFNQALLCKWWLKYKDPTCHAVWKDKIRPLYKLRAWASSSSPYLRISPISNWYHLPTHIPLVVAVTLTISNFEVPVWLPRTPKSHGNTLLKRGFPCLHIRVCNSFLQVPNFSYQLVVSPSV